ncbi:hypothetical protein EYF80_064707 [Liparis tanakae]|uniref:Uncharacterized protein n=1 Tax=Liparis tanakae TaxID=230148 RepID=A0A4Z2E8S6_9TELE|nr:hypothetical protein EYF80_064707 [Liparis tanakae]
MAQVPCICRVSAKVVKRVAGSERNPRQSIIRVLRIDTGTSRLAELPLINYHHQLCRWGGAAAESTRCPLRLPGFLIRLGARRVLGSRGRRETAPQKTSHESSRAKRGHAGGGSRTSGQRSEVRGQRSAAAGSD